MSTINVPITPGLDTSVTKPTLPPRVRTRVLTDDDLTAGINEPGYGIASEIDGVMTHSLRLDGNDWIVWPAQTDDYLSIEEMRTYIRELRISLAAAEKLQKHKPRPVAPCNAAITREVEALIANRDWTNRDAARAFAMTEVKLMSRLRGHTSWTVADLEDVSNGLCAGREERHEMIVRLGTIGLRATSAA